MRIPRRLLGTLALAASVAACAQQGANLPPLPETTQSAYRLGPEDVVRVTVFNDPRLTGEFRISDAGTIALPLVGTIRAQGRTTTEVERAVENEMRQKNLFRDPSAAVQVITGTQLPTVNETESNGSIATAIDDVRLSMSTAPRPHPSPSTTSPLKGGCDHSAGFAGTTSTCA